MTGAVATAAPSGPLHIVAVVGNAAERSRTRLLAQAITDPLVAGLGRGTDVQLRTLELYRLAPSIGIASHGAELPPAGREALETIASADLLVAVTPVYKGSYSGLFKHLFDLLDPEALVGRPVLLAANGGSDRHALVVDHQLRPLFAFFRALTVPSAVYAAEADFDGYAGIRSEGLRTRIAEATAQALALLGRRHPDGEARHHGSAWQRDGTPLPGSGAESA
ncbi:NAD(P)H-dependent oxidoreductase [Xylophilus sp.]|uniref:NAD(P)H-dependent oxidoreductase n=1 Tax=Xylophilus sp. TaxID=2653893 RepID=UPI0013BC25F0|nr:NAD(P)H-dependent oxidoreductase [Xylophilus sp.]KAF1042887.1 MAG: FMN reductase (NADPH) [Xylophilus sp.]